MRKIDYIFIDSDREALDNKSGHYDVPGFQYHFVVNSEACVVNLIDIQYPVSLIQGPYYNRDKYNNCSISIRYCGFLESGTWNFEQRKALINLLAQLRLRYPDAKILGISELDATSSHAPVRINPKMNELRKELSDLP